LRQNGGLSNTLASYTSPSAFGAAIASNGGIGGAEANSIVGTPGFVGTGTFAALYQLTASSAGKGAGRIGGSSAGGATDMGAWGNGATQIGCNFTSGSTSTNPVPNAPTLSVS